VPGHFHGTVAGGTTLAFMALTYYLIPVLFQREVILPSLAKWQPYLFGIGIAVLAVALMGAGTLGVPRRHWDITYAGQPLAHEFPGLAFLMMAIGEIAGLVAVIGGVAFILIVVGSLLIGKKIPADAKPYPRVPDADTGGHKGIGFGGFEAPGTFVLAMVLFAALVLYYFINFKYLATLWTLT
jgi:cytochrome c oxidase subunit 1